MSDTGVELRFDEPESVASARGLLKDLYQRINELQASLGALNQERPPRGQTINYTNWRDRRGSVISAHRKTMAHYRFVKAWLHEHELSTRHSDHLRPSKELHALSILMMAYERLFLAVGEYLEDGTDSESTYDAMEQAYDELDKRLGQSLDDIAP
ncbi:MAG TPA: hypothetical protein VLF67_03210 [Candidatus Saccharimonas sp.]|nr:hypothetical protein [Candidatus Saccharimonas sp.]